jgi:glycosyltransferase involved in cell wall biosynthesis
MCFKMRILFLDQSGSLGGAELCLLDIAKVYRSNSGVLLLSDGPFRAMLESHGIDVQVVGDRAIALRKGAGWTQGIRAVGQVLPRITQVADVARKYDLIYANTPKALVIGALASLIAQRPLVYHLHDIISREHFSRFNIQLLIRLANQQAIQVIANSEASQTAFIAAGGRADRVSVVYNGFDPATYRIEETVREEIRRSWDWPTPSFVVGHFSRLSPWKGQHVLLEALCHCPSEVVAVFVGDALFGEDDYGAYLRRRVVELGLGDRVKFLGFQDRIPELMRACDMVAHTSTAPEPFGRVIVEAMLSGTPVVAAAAGGALELVEENRTGWLTPPGDVRALAAAMQRCYSEDTMASHLSQAAQQQAAVRFQQGRIQDQIGAVLGRCCGGLAVAQ